MKINSEQLLNISAQILSGMMCNQSELTDSSLRYYVGMAIFAAEELAEQIPEDSALPSDEEIRKLCEEIIPKDESIPTLLLNSEIRTKLRINQSMAYSIIQKARQLGYIVAHAEGKKTIWKLSRKMTAEEYNLNAVPF